MSSASNNSNNNFSETSQFFASNIVYLSQSYEKYKKDPSSVPTDIAKYFEQLGDDVFSIEVENAKSQAEVIGQEYNISLSKEEIEQEKNQKAKLEAQVKKYLKGKTIEANASIEEIENLFIKYGHLAVNLDPLGFQQSNRANLETGLSSVVKSSSEVDFKGKKVKTQEVIDYYNSIYCGSIAAEFDYVSNPEEREWLKNRLEQLQKEDLSLNEQKTALVQTIKAEAFENYLHVKFPGAKRFSLEGGEAYIPAMEQILLTASEDSVKEVVIGMAHRGRLNTLTHVMGKDYKMMFSEFAGVSAIPKGTPGAGDVKYHMGYSNLRSLTNGKEIYLSLCPNPSHLESVNPVVMGKARAKQDELGDREKRTSVLPIIVHGDAAMIGQGVVAECLTMSYTKANFVGGTFHIAINNQIGFTAEPHESRSSTYCTDLAKSIEAPVFHVNGQDVDSAVKVAKLATEFRNKFGKDVFLDVVCYRKYGHNEGDEPMFTQPVMYSKIKSLKTPSTIYGDNLIARDKFTQADIDTIKADNKKELNKGFEEAKTYAPKEADWLKGNWKNIQYLDDADKLNSFDKTAITKEQHDKVAKAISTYPEGFAINKKVERLFSQRKEKFESGENYDWAMGELLAYGSLLMEGHDVRLNGEDAERGTFSHRHAVLTDQKTNAKYKPLDNIEPNQKNKFEVHNSVLSEYACLGFEYGYSNNNPDKLTIWEAQFGDFANGGAIMFDQYLSSAEDKWLRMSGLVCLMPHGYEGQGPEHSSARLERYLQACAKNNMIVANCTTPANFFHLLRRQIKSDYRKPAIVMSPKSLLRSPKAISKTEDFLSGQFETLIDDTEVKKANVKRVVFTSGKIYYDVVDAVKESGREDIAVVRVEQYYPFDMKRAKNIFSQYSGAKEVIWLQEEPKNMGAWQFIRDYIEDATNIRPRYIGREEYASTSAGFGSVDAAEKKAFLEEVVG